MHKHMTIYDILFSLEYVLHPSVSCTLKDKVGENCQRGQPKASS